MARCFDCFEVVEKKKVGVEKKKVDVEKKVFEMLIANVMLT